MVVALCSCRVCRWCLAADCATCEDVQQPSTTKVQPSAAMDSGTALDENGHAYVGLVNQASTCYLNSVLQALFMMPEFRNAIYKSVMLCTVVQAFKN